VENPWENPMKTIYKQWMIRIYVGLVEGKSWIFIDNETYEII
jgi:hypothetical protein